MAANHKLIDITDMTDIELDELLGMAESERVVTSVVRAPGPKRCVEWTHYSDGSTREVMREHATGYTTVTNYK